MAISGSKVFFDLYMHAVVNCVPGRGSVKEVCHTEKFAPKCDREDEVVVIETAQYGRLELGWHGNRRV